MGEKMYRVQIGSTSGFLHVCVCMCAWQACGG